MNDDTVDVILEYGSGTIETYTITEEVADMIRKIMEEE